MQLIASNIENSIFNFIGNDTSREYREKITFLKMRLKGSSYSYVRKFLFENKLTTD